MQASSTSIETVSLVSVSTTITTFTTRFSAITQNIETVSPIYLDFNLQDMLDGRLSQIKWHILTKLSADGNPVAVITMNDLALHYSIDKYLVGR